MAAWALAPAGRAADLYVDPVSGSDGLGDGSTALPWKTLTHAVASLPPGANTVHLAPGSYGVASGEVLPIGIPASADLELRGAGAGATTLTGPGSWAGLTIHPFGSSTPSGSELVTIRDMTFDQVGVHCQDAVFGYTVELQDVHFRNAPKEALSSSAFSGYATVRARDCLFDGNTIGVQAYGVGGWSATISLTDCVIQNGDVGISASGLATLGGGGGSGTVILTRCEVRGCVTGTQADGNLDAGSIGEGTIVLVDSLVADNQVGFSGYDIATLSLERSTIAGNAVGVSASGPLAAWVWVLPRGSCIWGNATEVPPGNVLFATYSNLPAGIPGTSLLHVDPQYADSAAGDYRLSATSPLIDAGDPTESPAEPWDLHLDPRVLDGDLDGVGVVDMGYSEWNPTHLASPQPAKLGTLVAFTVTAPAGSSYALYMAFAPGALPLGPAGAVLIDLASVVPLGTGATPGTTSVAVPADAALAGLELYLQAYASGPGTATLSNRLDRVLVP